MLENPGNKLGKEALVALSVLLAIVANLFVLKQTTLFSFNVTCSDAFAIGSIFGLNLLQQKWGKPIAKKTIWISFFAMAFFVVVSQIHLLYTPSRFDESHGHFAYLLSYAPRILLASITAFFITQQLDVRLFGLLQKTPLSWKNRSTISLLISQAVDTSLFTFLGLYGVVQELGSIMGVSYVVKCAVIGLTALLTRVWNPQPEQADEV